MILGNHLTLDEGNHRVATSESEDAYLKEYDEKLKKYHIYIIMCKVNRAFLYIRRSPYKLLTINF